MSSGDHDDHGLGDSHDHDHAHKHSHGHAHDHNGEDRHGARQPARFDPARAARLDDPRRFEHLAPHQVLELLDAPRGALVIDFGTGTGIFAIEIAKHRSDLRVIALDEQPGMLELLRAKPAARNLGNLEAVLTDEVERFAGLGDRILALNVLHELGDEAIKQMIGLLKPDGEVLFIDWDSSIDRPIGPPKDHTYDAAEARARLEGFGLGVELLPALKYHFVLRASKTNVRENAAPR
ncbi:MAG TPA: methyltransferase domain-containing protein [Candidatus Binataceae bacterium]|nr:methyltransferase domain-containing protein [Candidatus Binataceae bacterium]